MKPNGIILLFWTTVILASFARVEATPVADTFFSKPITIGAHRGGKALAPENTVVAFKRCAERWPDILLEGDARLSADGKLVLIHDETVDRTTGGTGPVADKTLAELKQLDAAYRFTTDGGASYPYRGKGITIPTLAEALDALPDSRFLIEMKPGVDMTAQIVDTIRKADAFDRVIVASFVPGSMELIRKRDPRVLTCFDLLSGTQMVHRLRDGAWDGYVPPDQLLAINTKMMDQFTITSEDIGVLHDKGIRVLIHTINNPREMSSLLDVGVDGILTDYPDKLGEILEIHFADVSRP